MSSVDGITPPLFPTDKSPIESPSKVSKKSARKSPSDEGLPLPASPPKMDKPQKFNGDATHVTLKPKPKRVTRSKDDLDIPLPKTKKKMKADLVSADDQSIKPSYPKHTGNANLREKKVLRRSSSFSIPRPKAQKKSQLDGAKDITKKGAGEVPKPKAPKRQEEQNPQIIRGAARVDESSRTTTPLQSPPSSPEVRMTVPITPPSKLNTPPHTRTPSPTTSSTSPIGVEIPGYINFQGRFFTPDEYRRLELGPTAMSTEELRRISARTPESLRAASPVMTGSVSPTPTLTPRTTREVQSDSMFVNLILDEALKNGGIRKQEVLWYVPTLVVEGYIVAKEEYHKNLADKQVPRELIDSIPDMTLEEFLEKIFITYGSGSCGATATLLEDLIHPYGNYQIDKAAKQKHITSGDSFVKILEGLVKQHPNENWFCRVENLGGHSFLLEYNKGKYQIHQSFLSASTAAQNLLKNELFSVKDLHDKLKLALSIDKDKKPEEGVVQARRDLFSSERLHPEKNGFDIRILIETAPADEIKQRLERMSNKNKADWAVMGKKKMSVLMHELEQVHAKQLAAAEASADKTLLDKPFKMSKASVEAGIKSLRIVAANQDELDPAKVEDLKVGVLYTSPRDPSDGTKYAYELLEITNSGYVFQKKKQFIKHSEMDDLLKKEQVFEVAFYQGRGPREPMIPVTQVEKGKNYYLSVEGFDKMRSYQLSEAKNGMYEFSRLV